MEYKFGSKSWVNFGLNSAPIMANWIPEQLEPSRHVRDLTNIAALFGHTKVALATPLYSLVRDVCSQRIDIPKPKSDDILKTYAENLSGFSVESE